ncbi:restriction endonuclease subunit S [Clostridium sp. C105KSO13]|uniref:restriction endonuclease subunit S n=1 Tax=Clostridium sp. C105KSO13 TaxID=1776045 RepID=UPI000740817D|nr:restriction endonuclease subunit S [Clostridium sp. C105KSO13]CUX22805.1 hypothetical protein BN3456_00610 [Clostridium sp. C105KSO13]
MAKLNDMIKFVSGSPQFRIKEVFDTKAPLYTYYGQPDIEDDLTGIESGGSHSRRIRTFDKVNTLCRGDVVFSLISGKSAIVRWYHHGYLYTQNYVKLVTDEKIDSTYIVYLLNENNFIKRQFQVGLQGSQVLKFTLKQLKSLEVPDLPVIEKQIAIGEIYFNQLRSAALRKRDADLETAIVLEKLRGINDQ